MVESTRFHSGDTKKNKVYFGAAGTRAQQAGGQRGGACHGGAPMLCRYAATSALLRLMAHLSAVQPCLQGR